MSGLADELGGGLREKRLPRGAHTVQSKAAAAQQITAEQLVREAHELDIERVAAAPKEQITDAEELKRYQSRKRREFESQLRGNSKRIGAWLKYAHWEEKQKELERSRSVFERMLEVDYTAPTLWLKYAELEMRNKLPNRARNVWERAVGLLPRVDQLWYKYALFEEQLGQCDKARAIFHRWITEWKPSPKAYDSYMKLERRLAGTKKEKRGRIRQVFELMVDEKQCRQWTDAQVLDAFMRFADFESQNRSGDHSIARAIFERCALFFGDDISTDFYVRFARFEAQCKEFERARAVYRFALGRVQRHRAADVMAEFMAFEKQFGDRQSIEVALVTKRRLQFERQLAANPTDYDSWFDLLKMEEDAFVDDLRRLSLPLRDDFDDDENDDLGFLEAMKSAFERDSTAASGTLQRQWTAFNETRTRGLARIREVYERAIAALPPIAEKRFWKRYIYLWIKYAQFEEVIATNAQRTREVFDQCLDLCLGAELFFSKVWVLYSEFELRQMCLTKARKVLGKGIGLLFAECNACVKKGSAAPPLKRKIFDDYIAMEFKLGEFDNCRALYQRMAEYCSLWGVQLADVWIDYAKMEAKLQETERVRGLLELALLNTDKMRDAERLWKAFVEFEVAQKQLPKARALFQRLLDASKHVRVWIWFAQFEASVCEEPANARAVFERGAAYLKRVCSAQSGDDWRHVEERVLLLEARLQFEKEWGSHSQMEAARSKLPTKVRRKRADAQYYDDYIFPEDVAANDETDSKGTLLLWQKARQWKAKKQKELVKTAAAES